ncbi:MoaD/ThiS family protein [Solimonas terrae]|uniref:MoaD/ThiS family protein n=1 Tax=Solimonas terrae TaxID=1396819 RepID=A0A6M2BMS4_9GAMM|nr:MoaD/ThiS family protein [Solimonas terrae]NGY03399.1 MoaD/ThiS family protein [Solimonas terrae]
MALTLTFEFHGQLLRLGGASEQRLPMSAPLTLDAALQALAELRPELAPVLARCACAIGDRLILRRELLQADTRIALLPPVAGG